MYREAREYLKSITKYGSVLGLDNIKELLRRLGNPQNELHFVHIAGTNGKGSTLAFTSTILKRAGYKVGRYCSPAVFSYREIIQVNEEYITKEALSDLTFKIKDTIHDMIKDGLAHPTVFEVETALAFLYFRQEKCDIVVLETGLGGLLDATNVVENTLVAVLTSISRDHMEYLGDTIGEIAWNKAGIIKRDSIVVTTTQESEAFYVIEEKCNELNNQLIVAKTSNVNNIAYDNLQIFFDYYELKNIEVNLAGSYQIENAVIAIETVRALNLKGFEISEESIKSGLRETKWLGRFTKICNEPLIIIDGAHNEAAAIRLKETIEQYFKDKKLLFIIGVLKDKEYERIAEILTPLAFKIITVTTPNHPRALSGEALSAAICKYNSNVEYVASIKEAVQICLLNEEGVDGIIAFGSLSYLGEFEACVKRMKH